MNAKLHHSPSTPLMQLLTFELVPYERLSERKEASHYSRSLTHKSRFLKRTKPNFSDLRYRSWQRAWLGYSHQVGMKGHRGYEGTAELSDFENRGVNHWKVMGESTWNFSILSLQFLGQGYTKDVLSPRLHLLWVICRALMISWR